MDMNEYVLEILARERLAELRANRARLNPAPGTRLTSRLLRRAFRRLRRPARAH